MGAKSDALSASDRTVVAQLEEPLARDVARCRPYTLTSVERLVATSDAVEYVVRRKVPGALVECGVWRGGSVLAMLLALQRLSRQDRAVWLYDTFEGMTEPGKHDVSPVERPAVETWAEAQRSGRRPWANFFESEAIRVEEVRSLLLETGYPAEQLHLVAGPVEETLPGSAPDQIAVLRLDTDWYESKRHELVHLYPRLSPGGVLIGDDYGHWQGARKALDEYLAEHDEVLLLHRTDYTGRVAVKPG
jgi:O-methyltransferase